MTKTTLTIDSAVLKRLARRKVHPRESYTSVLRRLLKKQTLKQADVDELASLIETMDILSDPDAMHAIARGIEDVKAGRLYSIDEV